MNLGIEAGEICNREGCKGVIEEHPKDRSCSCHIAPPCSSCVDDRHYCPECDWQGIEDQRSYKPPTSDTYNVATGWVEYAKRELDNTKIDYRIIPHTHFTQICEGVYPVGTTKEQVTEKVRGTFGGRFSYFANGKFKYIAYTD
jgi:hypothetical protein